MYVILCLMPNFNAAYNLAYNYLNYKVKYHIRGMPIKIIVYGIILIETAHSKILDDSSIFNANYPK